MQGVKEKDAVCVHGRKGRKVSWKEIGRIISVRLGIDNRVRKRERETMKTER